MRNMIGAFLVVFGFGMMMAAGGDPVMDTQHISIWTLILYAIGGLLLVGVGCAICGSSPRQQCRRF